MKFTRRMFAGMIGGTALLPGTLWAQEDPVLAAVRSTVFGTSSEFEDAMAFLQSRGNPDVVPALLTGLRFSSQRRAEIG